jgi:hypothetical protein
MMEEYSRKTSWRFIYAVLRFCNITTKKARTVEPEETAIARPRLCKDVSAAMKQHATVQELLETMFSLWSMLSIWSYHAAFS